MFCTSCGLRTTNGNGVCPNCGSHVTPAASTPISQEHQDPVSQPNNNEILLDEGVDDANKVSVCPICGTMNDPSLTDCVSCGNLLPTALGSVDAQDLILVKRIPEADRQRYFLVGLGLIIKFIRDKIPEYKSCFRCGEPVALGDRHCPRCRHGTVFAGLEALFKGNYEETLLRDLDELFPHFEVRDWTNAAYLPYTQLVTMKIDCEGIASVMASILRSLAVFLSSATQRTQLPISVKPFMDMFRTRVAEVPNQNAPRNNRPVPSADVINQIRRTIGGGPNRPWTT